MKLCTYTKYKDAGIDWIGSIPTQWQFIRLKYCVDLINEKIDGSETDLPYTGLEHIESWTGKRIAAENGSATSKGQANRYKAGDVLFGKLRPYLAKVLRSNDEGICTGELLVLRPKAVIQDYLFNYFLSKDFVTIVDSSTYGAKMPRASWEFIGNLPMLLPPDEEQRAIATFLDRETARIDQLIASKERQIELLQEKRTALISHTVTKGLNPKAEMKDSGIVWLGEIPEHWDIQRLKYVSTVNDETLSEDTAPLFELLYIDIGSVDSVQGIVNKEVVVFEKAPSRARRIVRNGDIIVSTVRTYLRAIAPIVNPESNLIVSTGFAVVRPRYGLESHFAAYALRAPYFVDTIVSRSVGVSYPAINASVLTLIEIALPSSEEQRKIALYLAHETKKIDAIVSRVKDSIDKLREYRTALISAAVTGKIDVRKEAV